MEPNGDQYAFEGQCALAVSIGKLGVEGSPRHFTQANGQTYLFKNAAARLLWRVIPGRAKKPQPSGTPPASSRPAGPKPRT